MGGKIILRYGSVLGVALLVFLGHWFVFVVPWYSKIQPDYSYSIKQVGYTDVYNSASGEFERLPETIEREDFVVEVEGDVMLVENKYRGFDDGGNVTFEGSTLYAVDRLTRANTVHEFVEKREGQFIFPLNVSKTEYLFHSPEILEAPSKAIYVGEELVQGLNAYKFSYEIQPVDKTAFFPKEKFSQVRDYGVLGGQEGFVWVEPVSGMVVKYEHRGENFLVDNDGERVAPFQKWFNTSTEDSISRLVSRSSLMSRNYNIIAYGVPSMAVIATLVSVLLLKFVLTANTKSLTRK